jgi:hypothetical protein
MLMTNASRDQSSWLGLKSRTGEELAEDLQMLQDDMHDDD